jgi:AraC family transcriptional regulator
VKSTAAVKDLPSTPLQLEDAQNLVIGTLRNSSARVLDPIIKRLASCLAPMIEQPELASRIFVDHVVLALDAQFSHESGAPLGKTAAIRGGLAPWQERRAKELMSTDLGREISLAFVARECKLSVSHFARSFKQCTGKPPHRWLLENRVAKAKELMLDARLPLAEIALECGFSDQSHFTRVFSRTVGTSPGSWQRLRQNRRTHVRKYLDQEMPLDFGAPSAE